MTDHFPIAMIWVTHIEPPYIAPTLNNPGLESVYGLTKRRYPGITQETTVDVVEEIYRADYWDAHKCGDLPPAIGLALFDALMISRPGTAVRFLRLALNLLPCGAVDDSVIQAARSADIAETLLEINTLRAEHCHHMVVADSSTAHIFRPRFKRLLALTAYIHDSGLVAHQQEQNA